MRSLTAGILGAAALAAGLLLVRQVKDSATTTARRTGRRDPARDDLPRADPGPGPLTPRRTRPLPSNGRRREEPIPPAAVVAPARRVVRLLQPKWARFFSM